MANDVAQPFQDPPSVYRRWARNPIYSYTIRRNGCDLMIHPDLETHNERLGKAMDDFHQWEARRGQFATEQWTPAVAPPSPQPVFGHLLRNHSNGMITFQVPQYQSPYNESAMNLPPQFDTGAQHQPFHGNSNMAYVATQIPQPGYDFDVYPTPHLPQQSSLSPSFVTGVQRTSSYEADSYYNPAVRLGTPQEYASDMRTLSMHSSPPLTSQHTPRPSVALNSRFLSDESALNAPRPTIQILQHQHQQRYPQPKLTFEAQNRIMPPTPYGISQPPIIPPQNLMLPRGPGRAGQHGPRLPASPVSQKPKRTARKKKEDVCDEHRASHKLCPDSCTGPGKFISASPSPAASMPQTPSPRRSSTPLGVDGKLPQSIKDGADPGIVMTDMAPDDRAFGSPEYVAYESIMSYGGEYPQDIFAEFNDHEFGAPEFQIADFNVASLSTTYAAPHSMHGAGPLSPSRQDASPGVEHQTVQRALTLRTLEAGRERDEVGFEPKLLRREPTLKSWGRRISRIFGKKEGLA